MKVQPRFCRRAVDGCYISGLLGWHEGVGDASAQAQIKLNGLYAIKWQALDGLTASGL